MVDDNDYQYHQPYVEPTYSLAEREGEYADPKGEFGAGSENGVLEDFGAGNENGVLDGHNPEMHAFGSGTE